jgi:hypothetical protein
VIRSRRISITLASVAGLLAAIPSLLWGVAASLAQVHTPGSDWEVLAAHLLPVAVLVGPVVLVSRGWNRLVVVGVGIAATILGYLVIFGWYQLDRVLGWQDVTYANNTGQEVVVFYSMEGEPLNRTLYLMTGEMRQDLLGYRRRGSWVRFVALSKGSSGTGLTEMLGTDEYYALFPATISPDQEKSLGNRKLFDRTFTWDELGGLGGQVVLTDTRGSP